MRAPQLVAAYLATADDGGLQLHQYAAGELGRRGRRTGAPADRDRLPVGRRVAVTILETRRDALDAVPAGARLVRAASVQVAGAGREPCRRPRGPWTIPAPGGRRRGHADARHAAAGDPRPTRASTRSAGVSRSSAGRSCTASSRPTCRPGSRSRTSGRADAVRPSRSRPISRTRRWGSVLPFPRAARRRRRSRSGRSPTWPGRTGRSRRCASGSPARRRPTRGRLTRQRQAGARTAVRPTRSGRWLARTRVAGGARLADDERRSEDRSRGSREAPGSRAIRGVRTLSPTISAIGIRSVVSAGDRMGRQEEVVEPHDRQLVGAPRPHAVRGMEDADRDQVRRGHDGRRRIVELEHGPQRGFAPGQAVVDDLDVAVGTRPKRAGP